jgi:hypothetical protein
VHCLGYAKTLASGADMETLATVAAAILATLALLWLCCHVRLLAVLLAAIVLWHMLATWPK